MPLAFRMFGFGMRDDEPFGLATMRLIIATTRFGWAPMAVSPESMTASLPSSTALHTSVASARRQFRGLHAFQHLRRRDHRHAAAIAEPDDPFLKDRHLRDVGFDAEIASRDHHRVGFVENAIEIAHGFQLLDLGDDVRRVFE